MLNKELLENLGSIQMKLEEFPTYNRILERIKSSLSALKFTFDKLELNYQAVPKEECKRFINVLGEEISLLQDFMMSKECYHAEEEYREVYLLSASAKSFCDVLFMSHFAGQ